MPESLDCRACGACCITAGPVPVYPEDTAVPRWRTTSVRRTVGFASWEADAGVRQMAKHPDGRCRALTGTPGAACACAIYPKRPEACSTFVPGSEDCLESRARWRGEGTFGG